MEIYEFDVKTAFLYGFLEANIYMEQPYGFEEDDRICHLKCGLYGLKQSSRQWNKRIVSFLSNLGFKQSRADLCVFINNVDNTVTYLALSVDDGIVCGNNINYIKHLLDKMNNEFEITSREAEFFVGLQIKKNKDNNKLKIYPKIVFQ